MANSKLGDFIINFRCGDKPIPTRSANPWNEIIKNNQVRLLISEPDSSWSGFPLKVHQNEHWQIWVIGEFYCQKPNLFNLKKTTADFNGHYVIIAYELLSRHWHILTDRFGSIHVYITDDGKRVVLGTFSPAVAAAASISQLDYSALAGFFTLGFFTGDGTYWHDLRIISPATHLILDEGGSVLYEYKTWSWYHEPKPKLSFNEALSKFAEQFRTVLRDQVRNKSIALPISGGLDSRSTLVPLTTNDQGGASQLFPYNYGYSRDSLETKIAKRLAEKRNLSINTWVIQSYLFDNIRRILASIEGFQDITQSRQAYVIDDLAGKSTHVLAAHWGDVWMDDMGFLEVYDSPSDDILAKRILRKFTKRGSQILLNLFRDNLPNNPIEGIEAQIEHQLHELLSIHDIDFKVKAWKTQNWSFRWTLASLRAFQMGLFPLLPFYDYRLTDLFCQLPSNFVKGRKLQIEYLKHYAPDMARVAWQVYDANLFNYQHYNSWLLPKRALKKLGKVLTGKKIIQRNWEVQFLNNKGRIGLENWLLTPGLKLHDFVKKSRLESFLNFFYANPDAANGYAVSMLLTFSAWLELYG